MFHITHPTSFLSTRGESPLGALMIDGTARTNDRSVLVDKKPVSANDMAAEWGQLQSERALFCWFCLLGQVVCVSAHAVTSWHLSLSDTLQLSQRSPCNGLILISWFKAERWTAGRVFFFLFFFWVATDGNEFFGCSCHSNTSLVLRVTKCLNSDVGFYHYLHTWKRKATLRHSSIHRSSQKYCARTAKLSWAT